jgi:UPF0042 nucleotide-binding protein
MKLRNINIISFGHKYGPPPAANLLFDVRFLKNPYYDEQLRPLTGLDAPVQRFFESDQPSMEFLSLLKQLLRQSVVGYLAHGSDHDSLTIAFGCTGGKHRSVFFAAQSEAILRGLVRELSMNSQVLITHRDKGRE